MSIIPIIFSAIGIGVILTVYLELPYRTEKKRQEEFEKKYQEQKRRIKMKWINEKTVQGEPNDENLTEVGKAIMLANSIVHCKDCTKQMIFSRGEKR